MDLFFPLSKLLWALAQPASLLLLLLLAALLYLWLGRPRAAKWILTPPVIALALIACLPLDEWLLSPLERRFPANPALPAQVDGIIVLGGALMPEESARWDQPELSDAAERMFAFAALARRYPEARLVFTGGSGQLLAQDHREADVARELLSGLGLDTGPIHFERESRNTWENAVFSQRQVEPAPHETWVLITSAYHMPRAAGIFCQRGWPVIPYPVDHNTSPHRLLRVEFDLAGNLALFSTAAREWLGLTAYFLTGRTPALFPGACRQSSD